MQECFKQEKQKDETAIPVSCCA